MCCCHVLVYINANILTRCCFCVYQVVNEMYGDNWSAELNDQSLQSNQYLMTEFAKKYFREAQRNRRQV